MLPFWCALRDFLPVEECEVVGVYLGFVFRRVLFRRISFEISGVGSVVRVGAIKNGC